MGVQNSCKHTTSETEAEKELHRLYAQILRLKTAGKMVNAYNGCEEDPGEPDGDVLAYFMEYIYVYHPKNRPDWLEAFYQVLCWQFTSFHEGVDVYYENFYGGSDRETICRTAKFLQENGYADIEEPYQKGIVLCDQTEQISLTKEIYEWLCEHTKEVWDFCVDILEKNRLSWPGITSKTAL